jgi:hypothetical protein
METLKGVHASVIAELNDDDVQQTIKLAAKQLVKQGQGGVTFDFELPGGAIVWSSGEEQILSTVTIISL